ncbi:MAG: hypothetical protein M1824_005136 [Vezdaea acicularis]|nr:MAG: hypothetical protein M1824_005136 [Vezdaea acicularis]
MADSSTPAPPKSILVVGSGVFGLSTISALLASPNYANTAMTLLSPPFSTTPISSRDHSRIIRADYSSPLYSLLASRAQDVWRSTALGAEGRYHESGLLLTADEGRDRYVRESLENVRKLEAEQLAKQSGQKLDLKAVRELKGRAEIKTASCIPGGGGSTGSWGYTNPSAGWADATASLTYFRRQIEGNPRVNTHTGLAKRLTYAPTSSARVTGCLLIDGTTLEAELVIVAAGAHSGSLVDLRGQMTATGQVLAYVNLTEEEMQGLKDMPVCLNMSTGLFVIPPHVPSRTLKVARHAFGYRRMVEISHPERQGELVQVSLPPSAEDPLAHEGIPAEGEDACRGFLAEVVPSLAGRKFCHTRLCWYSDTASGDFLICHHPTIEGLFLATGGSGHGFKFLPVLGEKIVEVLEGREREGFGELWRWKGGSAVDGEVRTEDGSRGLPLPAELMDEMAR